jgi:hypothetical protein
MNHVEGKHLYFMPLDGVSLGDRIAGKLADALCLLDEVLELTCCAANLRIEAATRLPIERARGEVNDVMRRLTN